MDSTVMNVNDRNVFSCGFSTARGSAISVSDKAISKVKNLFTEEFKDTDDHEDICKSQNKSNEFDVQVPDVGFQTARGRSINVTNEAISKAKNLFIEDFKDTDDHEDICKSQNKINEFDVQVPHVGFQTARGRSINVTNEAISKAKNLFIEDFKDTDYHDICKSQNKNNEFDVQVPHVGFQTARGGSINVTNEAISKAKNLFIEDFKDTDHEDICKSQNKSNEFDVQVPRVGFQTARGRSINVTNEAISKAKNLFTEEFKNPDYHDICKSQNKSNKFDVQVPNAGFQTARGRSINVTNEALLKAETLFSKEIVENVENIMPSLHCKTAKDNLGNVFDKALLKKHQLESSLKNETYEASTFMINDGFKTASGKHLVVTEQALQKAEKLLSQSTLEDANDIISPSAFKAPNNNLGSISKHKLLKNDLNDIEKFEDTYVTENNVNKHELQNVGFQTARGRSINVTNEALLKAETLFSKEILENVESIMPSFHCKTAKDNLGNVFDKALLQEQQPESSVQNETYEASAFMINDGFKTASGKHLVVTERAFQKAERLLSQSILEDANDVISPSAFKTPNNNLSNVSKHNLLKNDLNDTEKFEDTYVTENETNKHELQNVNFQTARGQSINVTKEALLKSNSLLYKDFSEDPESPVLNKSFQKRKIKEVDNDDTSLNRVKSNHFKKLRFSNEIQVQRTVDNNSINAEEKENQKMISVSSNVSFVNANKSVDNTLRNETFEKSNEGSSNSVNSLISHEIVASTVALLADEKNAFDSRSSSAESKENKEVPSSPVIGGQFISRKRKSVNNKRRSTNALRNIQNKSLCLSKESNDKCVDPNEDVNKETKCLIQNPESTNKTNRCDSLDSNEFDDTQLMMEFINQSENILQKRFKAISEQEKQISLKEKCKPKPKIGTLYLYRKTNHENRISWREISMGNKPVPCTSEELIERKLPLEILDITANNAITFRFRCTDFYGQDVVQNNIEGIKLDDGACIILDENGYVGITEIKRAFLASPGVDPSLLFDGWVENHYKWIVWKLASMDRIKLGSITLPRALTPARVMMELKYRYDREIDRSQRSALRKILEKDDVSSKRMVLCVESISEGDDCTIANNSILIPSKRVMLTDGWYSIQACVDQAMIKNVISGKIKEGTKLLTYGSELLNCDQGCSPLEAAKNVCLKMHTNSTRRVRWDAKLGYVAPSGPFCVKLKAIISNGGLVGKIKVLITRVYPMLYREKTPTGESIFRNARCEEKANIAYEKECRLTIETFYAKAEKYFLTETRKSSSNTNSTDLAVSDWNEECEKQEFMSKQEFEQLKNNYRVKEEKFRQKLESQLQETLPPQRQVTPLLKIRVAEEETSAILSIWSPSEEITDTLKEGNVVSICNVIPLGKRGNELQLSASRNTIFNRVNVSNITYPRRTYTPLSDVNKPTFAPAYGELDTVGVIVGIGNEPYGMKHFEAVYLAYPERDVQSSYISVLFWHGIVSHGYAEILRVGSFVACSNLEWRRATSWNIPMTYCTERTTFTRNPRQSYLQQPFEQLKYLIEDTSTYITTCAAEISKEVQKKSRVSDSYKNHLDRTLLNESPNSDAKFTNNVYQEHRRYSLPNQSAKSFTVQERIERLQRYGEPSNLSPLVLKNSSKRVSLEFQSPVRSTDREQLTNRRSLNNNLAENSR